MYTQPQRDAQDAIAAQRTINQKWAGTLQDTYGDIPTTIEAFIRVDTCVLLGIPPYGSASISITISNPGSIAKIGTLVVGAQKELGGTQFNPTIGISDYSTKDKDTFGNYIIVERAYSKKMSCETVIDNTSVDDQARSLAAYRAKPVVWVGADNQFSSMIIYGFFKNFLITIPGPVISTCSLEIEGLS
jgi:hypothetical protein